MSAVINRRRNRSVLAAAAVALVAGLLLGLLWNWVAGVFVGYWALWAGVVEWLAGLRNLMTTDSRGGIASRRALTLAVLIGLVLSAMVVFVATRAPDPLVVLWMLLIINTLTTAWALPKARRRASRAA